jgi:hypothetical protein
MPPARVLAVLMSLSLGCSAESGGEDKGTPLDAGGGDGLTFGETSVQDEAGLGGDVALADGLPPDMAPAAAVYAHSASTLYKLDPDSKAVKVIGNFSGCGSVVDIALDAKSNLYASAGGIFLVDKNTAKCTSVGGGTFAGNSLSFVPAGTIDPAKEVLVTYNGGQYMRVDIDKGTTSSLGSLPSGFASSGDIVSVKGGGTYVTVIGNGCGDCLLEVNPKTGAMIKNWGSLGTGRVYGIAYWAGVVYAFNEAGQIWEVSFSGTSLVTKEIPIPMKPSGLMFWGAGSTTAAPVVPVK